MDVVLTAALAFSLSQILLNMLMFLRSRRQWTVQKSLYLIFLLAVAGYLLAPIFSFSTPTLFLVTQVFQGLQTLVPGAFWLFSASLFEERFRLRAWQMGLVAITVVLPFIGSGLSVLGFAAPRVLFWTLPQVLEFVLLGLALWSALRFWRDDLVESRRDLRLWFCGIIGVYILVVLLMREVLFPGEAWLLVWQYIFVAVMLMVTNGLLLEVKGGLFYPETNVQVRGESVRVEPIRAEPLEQSVVVDGAVEVVADDGVPADEVAVVEAVTEIPMAIESAEPVPEAVLQQLTHLMEEEYIYRQMGLTIGQLASRLSLQEYRLRRIINAGLGYRNFNDFLNTYRIREASERLVDPKKPDEAILNIALDTGYRSLSSFNKAFKDAFGQTPTEYRHDHAPSL